METRKNKIAQSKSLITSPLKWVMVFLFFTFSFTGQAQNLDSLNKEFSKHNKDTVGIRLSLLLGRAYFNNEPQQAERFFRLGLSMSDSLSYMSLLGELEQELGRVLMAMEHPLKAIGHFENAIAFFENSENKHLANPRRMMLLYGFLGQAFMNVNKFPKALEYQLKSKGIAEAEKDTAQQMSCANLIGIVYSRIGNYQEAEKNYRTMISFAEALKRENVIATGYSNLGDIMLKTKKYDQAIAFQKKALQINLQRDSLETLGARIINFANLGEAYEAIGKYDTALYYVNECMRLSVLQNQEFDLAYAHSDLGRLLTKMGRVDEAIKHLDIALPICLRIKATEITPLIFQSYYNAYKAKKNYERALHFYEMRQTFMDSLNHEEMAKQVNEMEDLYLEEKREKQMMELHDKQKLAEEQNARKNSVLFFLSLGAVSILIFAFFLFRSWKKTQKQSEKLSAQNYEISHQKAEIESQRDDLEMQRAELQKAYQDIQTLSDIGQKITAILNITQLVKTMYTSVNSLMDASGLGVGIVNKQTNQIEFSGFIELGYELKDFADDIDDRNNLAVQCYLSKKEIVIGDFEREYKSYFDVLPPIKAGKEPASIIYLPLLLEDEAIGVITVQSFKKNAYTRNHITILKNLAAYVSIAIDNANAYKTISIKNTHITDSIRYAKTIQEAMLPKEEFEELNITDFFTLARPKDIVSGDFYWCAKSGDKSILAVVDCTGHGVPGAFMSMIGNIILNEIVLQMGITQPNEILTEFDKLLVSALHQGNKANNDAMEIAICTIENLTESVRKVQFSGAKRPLFYTNEGKIEVIRPTNRPVGGAFRKNDREFESHTLLMHKGECLYLSSDGFIDQSDPKKNKFGSPKFIETLDEINYMTMIGQKNALETRLLSHMGSAEQRDDITILGARL